MDTLIGYLTAIIAALIIAVSFGALALVITGAALPQVLKPKTKPKARAATLPAAIAAPEATISADDLGAVSAPPDPVDATQTSPATTEQPETTEVDPHPTDGEDQPESEEPRAGNG